MRSGLDKVKMKVVVCVELDGGGSALWWRPERDCREGMNQSINQKIKEGGLGEGETLTARFGDHVEGKIVEHLRKTVEKHLLETETGPDDAIAKRRCPVRDESFIDVFDGFEFCGLVLRAQTLFD